MVMEVLERAKELEAKGQRIIHMEVGEPDFPTPPVIVEAMKKALDQGHFRYAHSLGDPELREALSWHYKERYGLDISPGRFLVCPGTSVGLALLFGALLSPGDQVAMSNPGYSCYPSFIRFFGGEPLSVPVRESEGFRLTAKELGPCLNQKIKAILINSPANPTGSILEAEDLIGLSRLGPLIVSDEIYHGLSYQGERDRTVLEFTDRAVVIGGFSKSFAMTGWRIGYLVLPPDMVRPIQSMAQNFVISVNSAVQKAAAVALREAWPDVLRMRDIYDRRRRLLLKGLDSLGLAVLSQPLGAFYVLARASHINPDSRALVFQLLEKAGVGATPGAEFGSGAEGFLRFSYATSEENIEEGVSRIRSWLGEATR
jgi:aspartate/methionine/tyrosine aminotransferase